MESEREQIRKIQSQLLAAGFRARSDDWYLCVAVSMVWRPGTKQDIEKAASGIVAETLGWTGPRREGHPCWHMGDPGARHYHLKKSWPPQIGVNLTLDDLAPVCVDHDMAWRDRELCVPSCRYLLRLIKKY